MYRNGTGGGNARFRERCPFSGVVGHPEFDPHLATSQRDHGITCEWDVPDDVFMILVLNETQMSGVTGKAVYRPESAMRRRQRAAEPRCSDGGLAS